MAGDVSTTGRAGALLTFRRDRRGAASRTGRGTDELAAAGGEDRGPAPPAEEGAVAAALVPAGAAGAAVAGVHIHRGQVEASDLVARAVGALEVATVAHLGRG